MAAFWASLGDAGHIGVILGLLSVASILVNAMAKSDHRWLATIGGLLSKVIDFFSANLKHT